MRAQHAGPSSVAGLLRRVDETPALPGTTKAIKMSKNDKGMPQCCQAAQPHLQVSYSVCEINQYVFYSEVADFCQGFIRMNRMNADGREEGWESEEYVSGES
jgi:hypothetical protein